MFFLIKPGMNISLPTFIAASFIGLLSILVALIILCPADVFSFPSLLPMIPFMLSYPTIFSLIKIMQNTDQIMAQGFMFVFFHNELTTWFILLVLVVGVSLPSYAFLNYHFR